MLDKSCQAGRHSLSERGDDLYETPEVATLALLRAESLPHRIWEPACGRGAIVKVLRHAGHAVTCTDLVRYPGLRMMSSVDFLQCEIAHADCIVTNPPFKLAAEFVRHALTLCPRVIMLLRLAFYESAKRSDILDGGKLARIHVFANRLPMMHRDGWNGPKASSAVPFAWFVWDANHRKRSTTIDRLKINS